MMFRHRSFLPAALAGLALIGRPAGADFAAGVEAYDGGDLATAVAEWRAAMDDPEALVALAGLYAAGSGVARDPVEAARLYRRAADLGNADAQLNLGELYSQGRGVPRNLKLAYVWLGLAAEQGRRWPARQLTEIAAQMSRTELDEARRLLDAWPRH